jgi:hypothetical protein
MKFAGLVALSTIGMTALGVTGTRPAPIGAAATGGSPLPRAAIGSESPEYKQSCRIKGSHLEDKMRVTAIYTSRSR